METLTKNKLHMMHYIMPVFMTLLLFLSACGPGNKQSDESADTSQSASQEDSAAAPVMAKATLDGASGSNVKAEATFTQEDDGTVLLEISAENLTPGEHAVHLHEKGDCSASDASSAGGHWNPTMQPHGKRQAGGAFHKGDIANMTVGDDGKGSLKLSITGWTIGGADTTNILGKSVIIHSGADDFTSQPSGNAGSRVSCGVIKQS